MSRLEKRGNNGLEESLGLQIGRPHRQLPDKLGVDAHDTIVEAVAVLGNRIVAVGSNEEVRRYAGSETEIIDLGGKTAMPGIIDSHTFHGRNDAYWQSSLSPLLLYYLHRSSECLNALENAAPELYDLNF